MQKKNIEECFKFSSQFSDDDTDNTYTILSEEQSENGDSLLQNNKKIIWDKKSKSEEYFKKHQKIDLNWKETSCGELSIRNKSPRIKQLISEENNINPNEVWLNNKKRKNKVSSNFITTIVKKYTRPKKNNI